MSPSHCTIIRRSEEWLCSTFTLIRLRKIWNGLAMTWTLNSPSSSTLSSPSTLLGEELLLSDLNQLTQSPDHDLGRNSSIMFPLVSTCPGSNSIWSWYIRIKCETYRNFRCTCALFMIRMESSFEIFLLLGLTFHCLALQQQEGLWSKPIVIRVTYLPHDGVNPNHVSYSCVNNNPTL